MVSPMQQGIITVLYFQVAKAVSEKLLRAFLCFILYRKGLEK